MEKHDVIIIGGGPGGLSCARILAEAGVNVLLLERKKTIGPKVCAGGITWDGLIQNVPDDLIERSFNEQFIYSTHQRVCFRKKNPIIATVDRKNLGQWMLEEAVKSGAQVRSGLHCRKIEDKVVTVTDDAGKTYRLSCENLVGADGASSTVRRFLGIPAEKVGIGINYQVAGQYTHMEWHLNTRFFGNGYGWIFPHKETISIGAFGSRNNIPASELKKSLIRWGRTLNFDLEKEKARAELINFDFRGFQFDNIWLVGDAAGLASGLTGEGIHPAIVSGKAVARKIIDPSYPADEIYDMVKKQKRHQKIVDLSARNTNLCTLLMETLVLMLRMKLLDFQKQLSM